MKKLLIVIVLLFSNTNFALADKLTESAILGLLSNIESSVKTKNAGQLTSYFTNDCKVTMVLPDAMGGTLTFNKAQYKMVLEQGWATSSQYAYEVKDIKIDIASNGLRATVTDVTYETVVVGGQKISSRSNEIVDIVLQDGKPMVAGLHGVVAFE